MARAGAVASLLLTLTLIASAVAAQPAQPSLPQLALDTYPAPMRESLAPVYRAAVERPSDPEAVARLGRLLHAWEQWAAAHDVYARLQALAPRAFEWQYLDGHVLKRLGKHGDAAARFRAAAAMSPGHLPARVRLAETLFETGALDESESHYAALTREPAAEPEALYGLGRIAAAKGQHEAAVARFQRAIALFPEWGAAHYALALSLRALGRREEAQRALERHAAYGPRWPGLEDRVLADVPLVRDDVGVRLQRGAKLADAGDLAGSIAEYEAALARDPQLALAHGNLIKLYGRAGDWAKAEAHYRAAVALGANLADVHYDHGVLLGLQGKWELAAEAYQRALSANPLHAQARNNLGQILERERKLEEALGEYRRAVESQPAFRLARFNAGRMLVALGRSSEAVAEFEKIVEPRDAESPRYLFALAVAYVRVGRKDDGIKWAGDARQLAIEHGQQELAAAIERELEKLK
jgi:tetratricopeptide (TPR) repeat protein